MSAGSVARGLAGAAFAMVAVAASAPARAEPIAALTRPPRNALIADLGLHVIAGGYQRSLAPWLSAQIVAGLYSPWTQSNNSLGLSPTLKGGDLVGAVVRTRIFVYPFASAPAGLWISPFTQYGLGWATRDGQKRIGAVGAVGASVGYTLLLWKHVLAGLGGGLQYHAARIPRGEGPPSFGRLFPQLEIQVGYAF
ncbi:MAG: hypothetical protein ABJE95_37745 [Byssovorax sp.]